ncbi:hypothetical protein [Ancylomarina sp. 16SWW S1-10-2]|nr:hypothetical protein [Ancylomarina sp. 16SWW S1-10-2]
MGAVLIIALEIAFFVGYFLIWKWINVKPISVKVKVDSYRRSR